MASPRVLIAGETLVDFLPDSEEPLSAVEGFTRRAGGAPANVAAALATLGETPWLATRLGADGFGDFLAATLADLGVPRRFVQRDPDRPTALAFVPGGPVEEFTFYRRDTADLHLDTGAIPDAALEAVSVVCVGGVMLAARPARSATLSLVERAREHGCTVVLDPNSRPELWNGPEREREVLGRALALADVVVAAADDTPLGDPADTPRERAEHLLAGGPGTAVVTRGEAGAFALADGGGPWPAGAVEHPGHDVEAVDPTGAGDAFLAGLVVGLLDGADLADAVDVAAAVGALATTGRGAMAALPDREAVATLRAED
jgi:fructokinase